MWFCLCSLFVFELVHSISLWVFFDKKWSRCYWINNSKSILYVSKFLISFIKFYVCTSKSLISIIWIFLRYFIHDNILKFILNLSIYTCYTILLILIAPNINENVLIIIWITLDFDGEYIHNYIFEYTV